MSQFLPIAMVVALCLSVSVTTLAQSTSEVPLPELELAVNKTSNDAADDEASERIFELAAMGATYENGNVVLHWVTASELNNARFEVERAMRTHEKGMGPWITLAFVSGAGTTDSLTNYEYFDKGDITGASQVLYRLKQVSFDGNSVHSEVVEASLPVPKAYAVSSYTNPYAVSATIEYDIPQRRRVRLTIYDEEGRKVETLVNQIKPPGRYRAVFNAINQDPGLYMYRLEVSGKVWVEPILLVR